MNQAEQSAQNLLKAAQVLGEAIEEVGGLCLSGLLKDEEQASNNVLIEGEYVASSLRRLAMRLDRAAYLGDSNASR